MPHLRYRLIVMALWIGAPLSASAAGWTDAEISREALREGTGVISPSRHMEFGWGLHHETFSGSAPWYGVYLQGIDRVAERNTPYAMPSVPLRTRSGDAGGSAATCCAGSDTITALEQHPRSPSAHREESPTVFLFGDVRPSKRLNVNLDDGWRLQAGTRKSEYTSAFRTRTAYFIVDRGWGPIKASYSFQLERAGGLDVAPHHVMQLEYAYRPGGVVAIAFTSGRQISNFGPLGVLETSVTGVALRAHHWLERSWALSFEAAYSDHGDLPTRVGVRMGLRHSF